MGNIDNAVGYCLINLMINPDQPHVWCNLGKIYRETHKIEEAKNCYREAIKIDKGYFPAIKALEELNADKKTK
jgi:tetratricopeptide (TPR) repeat protein